LSLHDALPISNNKYRPPAYISDAEAVEVPSCDSSFYLFPSFSIPLKNVPIIVVGINELAVSNGALKQFNRYHIQATLAPVDDFILAEVRNVFGNKKYVEFNVVGRYVNLSGFNHRSIYLPLPMETDNSLFHMGNLLFVSSLTYLIEVERSLICIFRQKFLECER